MPLPAADPSTDAHQAHPWAYQCKSAAGCQLKHHMQRSYCCVPEHGHAGFTLNSCEPLALCLTLQHFQEDKFMLNADVDRQQTRLNLPRLLQDAAQVNGCHSRATDTPHQERGRVGLAQEQPVRVRPERA